MKEIVAIILISIAVYAWSTTLRKSPTKPDRTDRRARTTVVVATNSTGSASTTADGSVATRWKTGPNAQADLATTPNSATSPTGKTPIPDDGSIGGRWKIEPKPQSSVTASVNNAASSAATQTPAPPGSVGARWKSGPNAQTDLSSPIATATPGDGSITTRWKPGSK